MIFELDDLTPAERQHYLQHAIAPRPICLASTVDKDGNVNLSPFSFFNLFSVNPPVIIFSPSRRVRDNTTKHTLDNLHEVPEVVVNIVDYDMVQQISLASCDYLKNINEFLKAGLTEERATIIKPPMVKESKVKMECRVMEIKSLGTGNGAGNLVICEILMLHIDEQLMTADKKMDQRKLNLVARLGDDWYCRIDETNLFEVQKPTIKPGIGIDALPDGIRHSTILTGNHLGQLGQVHDYPFIDPSFDDDYLRQIIQYYSLNPEEMEREVHIYAKSLLDKGRVREAWQVLLAV